MFRKEGEIVTDNAAEGLIDTNAVIQTTTHVHRIRWAVENVSQLPVDTKVIGPDFYPTKTCLCNIVLRKSKKFLLVFLCNKSDRTIYIERSLILSDSKGATLHQEKMGCVFALVENEDINITSPTAEINRFNSLQDDILIIDCSLKMEGSARTEISFFMSEIKSREHLIEDLKTMFNNPVDSDFTLQIGNEFIHSHKSLLRSRSIYFKRMFDAEMKESAKNSESVSNITYSTMHKLVLFLYTGGITETFEDNNFQQISDLYLAADKYGVIDLRALCADKLMCIATVDNVCQVLQLAHGHRDEDLKIRAMNFISLHFNELERTEAWSTFMFSEHDLASDVLNMVFEDLNLEL